jgi:hypothetical protein
VDPDPGCVKKSRSGSGMNIPDNISGSLETIFGLKILKFFDEEPDPGFEIRNLLDTGSRIRDGKIRIRNLQ